jgi:hypothetical protein
VPHDTQIFVGKNRDGSSDYDIPSGAEIRVLAVNANFADNGAGTDWLPAVVMFSDSGSVIARALLPDVKVTAGDDAEVSWFPGVKSGGGASSGVAAWGFVQGSGAITDIAGNAGTGNPTVLTWDASSFGEDGSGTFFFDPLNPAYIQCHTSPQPGYFTVYAGFVHDNSTPSAVTFGDIRSGLHSEAPTGSGPELTHTNTVQSSDVGDPSSINDTIGWVDTQWAASRGDTTPIGFYLQVENFNAGGAILHAVPIRFAVALVAA